MEFVPEGCIDLIEAKNAVREALYPGEMASPAPTGETQRLVHEHDREARERLLDALRNEALTALIEGRRRVQTEYWDSDGAWGTMQTGMLETAGDPRSKWARYHGYSCFLDREEFKTWLALQRKGVASATPKEERPEYTPPYLAFMLQAARQMNLNAGTRTSKENIEQWLYDNWPNELGKVAHRKVEYMATFLRHPQDEKGGYFKRDRNEEGGTP